MWVDNLNPQKFMSKDTISNQKFSRSVKVSKAHDTIIKYSKTGKTRGMSTFDFDETVGISENFIIAKKDREDHPRSLSITRLGITTREPTHQEIRMWKMHKHLPKRCNSL